MKTSLKTDKLTTYQEKAAKAFYALMTNDLRISDPNRPAASYNPSEVLSLNTDTLKRMAGGLSKIVKLDKQLSTPDDIAELEASITGSNKRVSREDLANQLRYEFVLNHYAAHIAQEQADKATRERQRELAAIDAEEAELNALELQTNPEARKAKLAELKAKREQLSAQDED